MSFFKKLLSLFTNGNPPPKTSESSTDIELIPNKLWVRIYVHQIPATMGNDNQKALAFKTRGLQKQGQQELFFVLKPPTLCFVATN